MNKDYLYPFIAKNPLLPTIGLLKGEEAWLFSKLNLREPILDLGCGNGFFAEVAVSSNVTAGLDNDLEQAKRAGASDKFRYAVVGDICELPYRDASFATIISNCVLEHVPNLERAFQEVSRVLMPGGSLVFTVPTDKFDDWFYLAWILRKLRLDGLARKQNERYNRMQFQYHLYPVREWSERLEKAGFLVEYYQYYASWAFLVTYTAIDDFFHMLGNLLVKKESSSEACATRISERFSGNLLSNAMARFWWCLFRPFHQRVLSDDSGGAAVFIQAKKRTATSVG